MKKLFLFAGGLGITCLYAQSLTPQVIASSGTIFSSASAKLEFTIGEVATQTLTAGNTLTQGFHQPQISFASVEDESPEFTFNLYPNPTEQFVTVESSRESMMQVHVFDALGKAIFTSTVFEQKITIDLQQLAAGSYILRVTSKDGKPLHSYRVIKTSAY